ncbi:MAG TPA: DUF3489 domain-containing protein [Rhizomicrobium sp.]
MRKSASKAGPKMSAAVRPRQMKGRVMPTSAKPVEQQRRLPKTAEPKAPKRDKIASMTTMLSRAKGASIGELCKVTGWQAHSVRAAISSAIKKRLELDVSSEKIRGVRVYRVIV